MKFLVNLVIVLLVIPVNIKKIVLLLINSLIFDCISNTIVCEDNSVISLADDGGIELRNYDIAIIRFNF